MRVIFFWQGQYLVKFNAQFLWQAQHLVKLINCCFSNQNARGDRAKNLSCAAGCGLTASFSDHGLV